MSNNYKQMVLEFLKENKDHKFSIKQIVNQVDGISYPTLSKWIEVLKAEDKIKIDDYGNVKLIYINGKS